MQEYHNKSCALCGEKFKENDNIAICPECGTPIHKDCWKGHCPNEAKHAEGFDWNKSEAAETYKKVADSGRLANESEKDSDISDDEFFRDDGFENRPMIQIRSVYDFTKELKANPIKDKDTGEELTCYGVKQTELIAFLGEKNFGTPRLVMNFLRMANSKQKASINFFAGLLMPYYQFYQRMIGPASILLLLEIILSIPAFIYNLNYVMNSSSAVSLEMSGLGGIVEILSFVGIAIQILVAVFNDYIYMRWSVNKILGLREKYKDSPETRYNEALANAGTPKFSLVLISFAITTACSWLIAMLFF